MRSVLSLFDVSDAEVRHVLEVAARLKADLGRGVREPLLAGRVLALLFEKPSLRTRVSFEAGMAQLGGNTMFLGKDVGWGERESLADFGRVLGQYVDVVVCRANSHQRVVDLAQCCACPVINGLTDLSHPCQALADLLTLREVHGAGRGLRLAYVGDANNVARSLAIACGKLDVTFAIAAPTGYQFDREFVQRLGREAPRLELIETTSPVEAVRGAHAIYTDVWTSMGQEAERAERERALADYQVNEALLAEARRDAIFLHCLPARRGEEVTDAVIDGPQSAVIQQAANRMHAQKGLLAWLLAGV